MTTEQMTPQQATAIKQYMKASVTAEKHLDAAATALAQMHCYALAAGLPVKGQDDTRITLQEKCREYAGFLSRRNGGAA